MDNKLSNILGVKIPDWLYGQLVQRSNKNSLETRSKNSDILYMTQKTAWVRLVSSVDILGQRDKNYFKSLVGEGTVISEANDLAKNFILFAGTSKFNNRTETNWLRTAIYDPNKTNQNPAYGMLGSEEIKQFGYRPMPGLLSVNIETQGRLGSVRGATINFKCWNKTQLDIIDALYFKLGYTMFLEWGHVNFVSSEEKTVTVGPKNDMKLVPGGVYSTEMFMMNPFENDLSKEEILEKIANNVRDSEGNYDAMLGMCTNFNFSYNQEGGYDCTLKLMSMGILADSTKINHTSEVPGILDEQIKLYNELLKIQKAAEEEAARKAKEEKDAKIREYEASCVTIDGQAYIKKPGDPYDGKLWDYFLKSEGLVEYVKTMDPPADNPGSDKPKNPEIARLNAAQFISRFDPKKDSIYYSYPSNSNKLINEWFELPGTGSYFVSEGLNTKLQFGERDTRVKFISNAQNNLRAVLNRDLIIQKVVKSPLSAFWPNVTVAQDLEKNIKDNGIKGATYTLLAGDGNNTVVNNDDEYLWRATVDYAPTVYDPKNRFKRYFLGVELLQQFQVYGKGDDVFEDPEDGQDVEFQVNDPYTGENLENVYEALDASIWAFFRPDGRLQLPLSRFKQMMEDEMYNATWRVSDRSFTTSVTNNNGFKFDTDLDYTRAASCTQAGMFMLEAWVPIKFRFKNTKLGEERDLLLVSKVAVYSNDTAIITKLTSRPKDEDEPDPGEGAGLLDPPLIGEPPQSENPETKKSPLAYLSAVEIALRAIQVHSLIKNLEKGANSVTAIPLWEPTDVTGNSKQPFIEQVYSGGILGPIIRDLINFQYVYTHEQYKSANKDTKFKIRAQYGFATALMSNRAKIDDGPGKKYIEPVNYQNLLTSFVVPYEINQSLEEGTIVNHPVYISLGFFMSLLSNSCLLYDTGKDGKSNTQTPMSYLDFNPNHNFCLSNKQHLSTDPFTALIPFEGQDADFKALIDEDVVEGDNIMAPDVAPQGEDGNTTPPTTTPIWKPRSSDDTIRDQVSGVLVNTTPFKDVQSGKVHYYRGRMMNILLNIDFLMGIIKGSASKSEENRVNLKPVMEQIISSLNKCLGNINVFRFSYVDAGNVHQITDDQIVPPRPGSEEVVTSSPKDGKQRPLPLVGKKSIAKSLDIKSEVSGKLGNMMAISANSDTNKRSTLGSGGDTFGFVNENFVDRYIPNRTEPRTATGSLDGKINTAVQFNNAIKSFYNSVSPDQGSVEAATSYYVDRMSNVKGKEKATRASAMIPVTLGFKTNGISGLAMGHCFTVPEILLPYTYTAEKKGEEGVTDVVGFVVTGVSNTIEGNIWDTSIKSNMIFLKNKNDYAGEEGEEIARQESRLPARPNPFSSFDDAQPFPVSPGEPKSNLSSFKKALLAEGFNKEMTVAAMANVMKECSGLLIEEKTNYLPTAQKNPQRLRDVFGVRMGIKKYPTNEDLVRIASNEDEFLEAIYGINSGEMGVRLGNTTRGDAKRYKGRPWIGLTGKGGYERYSKIVYGDDRLVKTPELLMQPQIAGEVSARYLKNLLPQYEQKMGLDSKSITQADANLLVTSMVGGNYLNRNNLTVFWTEVVSKVDSYSKTISKDYDSY